MKANLPIEVDPEIMSGAPVFRGTRVPVQSLFEYLEDNLSLDEFLDCFPTVKREDAIAVLEHSKQQPREQDRERHTHVVRSQQETEPQRSTDTSAHPGRPPASQRQCEDP